MGYFIIFSKIEPSENNRAARSLSKQTQNQNIRTMQVNSQVTAVITIFEAVFQCINMFVYAIIARRHAGIVTLAPAMLLYFVILSYAFLMNTRYNKNRVVEEGWKNVLRNVIGCKNVAQSVDNHETEESNSPHQNKITRSLRHMSSMIRRYGNRKNIVEPLETVKYYKNNDICIISKNQHLESRIGCKSIDQSIDNHETGENNIPRQNKKTRRLRRMLSMIRRYGNRKNTVEPFETVKYYKNDDICIISKNQHLESRIGTTDSNLNVGTIDCNLNIPIDEQPCSSKVRAVYNNTSSNNISIESHDEKDFVHIRSQILSDLLLNIKDEKNYIDNFKRLIRLEEAYKNGQEFSNLINIREDNPLDTMPHFIGNVNRRVAMRKEMLKTLQRHKNEDDIYEDLFEQFINMEEDFVDNGC